MIGPSGGRDGGAGTVCSGLTFIDGAVDGKNCGSRFGLDSIGSVPGMACASGFVYSLTWRLVSVREALFFWPQASVLGVLEQRISGLKMKAGCGTEGLAIEIGTSCCRKLGSRPRVVDLANEGVDFGFLCL